jgi:NAD(P)-dependent dehydrogenase (short-subunit alcohol dehydrogenase family)
MNRNLFDLNGRVAVATGATTGLDDAIALGMAEADWSRVIDTNLAGILRSCQSLAAVTREVTGRVILRLAFICRTSRPSNLKIA